MGAYARGWNDGDMHKDYIEEAGYKANDEYVINSDGLRYIEKFMKRANQRLCHRDERTTENR
jgi:hypothetical protein